jgi:hypothetical protein
MRFDFSIRVKAYLVQTLLGRSVELFRSLSDTLLRHKWFPIDINLVEDFKEEELKTTKSAFDNLVLPDGHSTLLQALIQNQVRAPQEEYEKPEGEAEDFQWILPKAKARV